MNIHIDAPYDAAIRRIIEKGYAGTQTEAIRQAILAYDRMIEEEEQTLVHRAVEIEMAKMNADKVKTHSFQDIKKLIESER
jgi:Arc/MetJ-type ribon-helix-helix transcriptional regulator